CFSYEDANNCLALAQNYREKRNFTDSLNMFDRSCKLKNGQGCFFAYEISGYLSLQSRYKYYLQNGCALKHINSCIYLAEYSKGSGDLATARYAYKEACLMGIDESCEG